MKSRFCLLLCLLGTCCLTAVSLRIPERPSPTAGFIRNPIVGLHDSASQHGKIAGGSDAEPGELPWQVSIQVKPIWGDWYHNCGGTILNPTHIITAAHCLEGQILNQISIVAGAHNIKENESTQQIRYPKRLIWHDNFHSEYLSHDVGVITVTQPFFFNDQVQPLNISAEGFVHTGECVNSGWGNANPTGEMPVLIPDALQKITLEIFPRDNCTDAYNGIQPVDDTMVCARGLDDWDPQGSCNGDSGGPLTCYQGGQAYLAGIVSWGMNPCGQYHYPTVFGDVGSKNIRDFILVEGARP